MRGLCGNFNGDPQDDLVTLDRTVTNNVELFANSHKTKHCPELHVAPNLTCTSDDHLGWYAVLFYRILSRNLKSDMTFLLEAMICSNVHGITISQAALNNLFCYYITLVDNSACH